MLGVTGGLEAHNDKKSFYYFHAFFGTVLFRMPGLSEWRGLPAPTRGCFASAELAEPAEPALSMLLRTGRAQQGQEEAHHRHRQACTSLLERAGAQANAWDA